MYALRIVENWCPCPCQGSILHPLQEDFCLASCKNIQNKHNNTPSLTTISYLWMTMIESSLFLFKNAQKRTFLCYEVINWWSLVTVSVWLWIMAIDRSQHPDIHVSSMVTCWFIRLWRQFESVFLLWIYIITV